MKKEKVLKFIFFPIIIFSLSACIEEFEAETQGLETLLVVDALITDVSKNHEIQISRVFALEAEAPTPELGATVSVFDDQGGVYPFQETQPGLYVAQSAFATVPGRSYQLRITTTDGKSYGSTEVRAPENVPVGDINPQRIINDEGQEGVGVFLDYPSNGEDPYFFRYEFDETYKIIAPRWEPFRFEVVRYEPCFPDPFVVDIVTWEDERRTCFGSRSSERFIQASSVDLDGNSIENFQLHFLSRDNYIISHRYSINVTQFTQTQDAYSFYERLLDFSSTPDIFSQVQPGFLEGNINQLTNAEERVLGYFEVASVSEKRMYFNYQDLFPGEPLPPYASNCETFGNPRLVPPGYTCYGLGDCEQNCDSALIELILANEVVFASQKEDDPLGPYYTWPTPCGDCTQLGSNVTPEFWSEE